MENPLDALNWMGVQIVAPQAEKSANAPTYLPGDIVWTGNNEVGVIVEATVVVNGGRVQWNFQLPTKVESGGPPDYRIVGVPGPWNQPHKESWWTADEFRQVLLGPLHYLAWKCIGGDWVPPVDTSAQD